ncbi:MAG: hypothetical protein PW788_03615 [Micavibrio sp.]|nr:hypothetical protein [Micavibrio sp.]
MTAITVEQALENIYTSLKDDNRDIDNHIAALKEALTAAGQKTVTVEPEKLVQNNRAGRKMMESYFKKRGVTVNFAEAK